MLFFNTAFLSAFFYIERFVVLPMKIELLQGTMQFFRMFLAFYICGVHVLSAMATAGRNELVNNKVLDFVTEYVDKKKGEIKEKL